MGIDNSRENIKTGPQAMAEYWATHHVPDAQRFEEAQKQATARVVQIMLLLQQWLRMTPSIQPLLELANTPDLSREQLRTHAAGIVQEDGEALSVFQLIEEILAVRTQIHTHMDLADLRAMLRRYNPT